MNVITKNLPQEKITSGKNIPLWIDTAPAEAKEKINSDTETDVLIVGAGIAGLSTAYQLLTNGKKVVVLEDGFIGSGESGRSTGHLTCALDDRYYELERIFNEDKARMAAQSHMAAIDWIETTVNKLNIDCEFNRVEGFLFSHESDDPSNLEKEYNCTKKLGLNTEMIKPVPFIDFAEGNRCIKFPEQAQFHIMKYLSGLARAVLAMGGKIFTGSKAENINSEGAEANGFRIKAKHVVVATNAPVNDFVTMHTKQWPYRTYVIAAKVPKGTYPYSLWWDTGNTAARWITAPYHYVRIEALDDTFDLLVAGGEDHRTGQANDEKIPEEDRYQNLLKWTKKHFPKIEEVIYQWSGQVIEPIDSLGFMGLNPGNENVYIITGDSGNGLTHATIGAGIISDLICKKENPWADLYSPSRITINTAGDYFHEVGNMVVQLGDWFGEGDLDKVHALKPGEGAVVNVGLKKVAAYRDDDNHLHLCSAVCTHLGGILQWNADEKTFDCPMHGSRFTVDGIVLNGPAKKELKKVDPPPVN